MMEFMAAAPWRERILSGVKLGPSGCMEWQGAKNNSGYGSLHAPSLGVAGAHRVAFAAFWHPIPSGMRVLHACDNRACCNPQHLTLGTASDNSRDMVKKGRHRCPARQRERCPRGHAYDALNANGARICKICAREATRRWKEKQHG